MPLPGIRGALDPAPGRPNQNLFDLLQFEARPLNTLGKPNAVTCGFVPRKGESTWRVPSKLQQIEKFFVRRVRTSSFHPAGGDFQTERAPNALRAPARMHGRPTTKLFEHGMLAPLPPCKDLSQQHGDENGNKG